MKRTIATLALLAIALPASADVTADCDQVTIGGPGVFYVQIHEGVDVVNLADGVTTSFNLPSHPEANWAVWNAIENGNEPGIAPGSGYQPGDLQASGEFCETTTEAPEVSAPVVAINADTPQPAVSPVEPFRSAGVYSI